MKDAEKRIERKSSFNMLKLGDVLNKWLNKYRLGAQLNISFALVMLVPMIIATLFSIIYYSNKIEEEAVNKISSDANMAKLIYQHAQGEMENLADAYAKRSALRVLTNFILAKKEFDENLARKLGNELAQLAPQDNLDMITMVDTERRVFSRSHSPGRIGDVYQPKAYFEKVFQGKTFNGVESLTAQELKNELKGEAGAKQFAKLKPYFRESQNILTLVGVAPVYDKRKKLQGALIARRLLTPKSQIVSEACRLLNTNAALFAHDHLVTSCITETEASEFVEPPQETLQAVLQTNRERHIADISRGGSISKLFPLRDFDGKPVGVFMVQSSVNSYLRTRNIAIITSLCIFLIGVLLAYSVKKIIERRIVEPLNDLKIGTELVASGEYSHTLDVSSGDEIGELTQAFNNMTQDLENYDKQVKANKAQLEIKVKERTADLTKALDNLVKSNQMLEDTMETLNPGVSKLIENNKQELGLVYATELVVDICTYTTLNMTLGEDMMGGLMKTFFRESHKLLAKYRGVFDKTVGDQIVAIFGISKDNIKANPHHPFDAVECARKVVEVAAQINQTMHAMIQENYTAITERHKSLSSEDRKKIKLDELKFRCRVGINTSNPSSDREIDKMRMVMMGAETCVDYTAQGGSIIYAFRLESGGTPGEIGIGENTKRMVENVYQLKELGKVTLKGLGEQNEYRVIGRQPLTENIYPKTLFYRQFHENIPPVLTQLMEKIKMGAIQLNEVRKLSKSLEVDLAYLEHITGIHNLVGARALFAYAVGQLYGLEEDRVNAILLASLLRNGAMLRNIAVEFMNFVSKEVNVPQNLLDNKLAKQITDDLNQPRPEMIESKIINICNYFDHNAFDRTNLRQREAEVTSSKIVIEAMLEDRRFNSKLIKLLKKLMIADESHIEGKPDRSDDIRHFRLMDNPLELAHQIKKRFSAEEKAALIRALAMDRLNGQAHALSPIDETTDLRALPEQTENQMDTIDIGARAIYEDEVFEPSTELNQNDTNAIDETASLEYQDTAEIHPSAIETSDDSLPLNGPKAEIEAEPAYSDDPEKATVDLDAVDGEDVSPPKENDDGAAETPIPDEDRVMFEDHDEAFEPDDALEMDENEDHGAEEPLTDQNQEMLEDDSDAAEPDDEALAVDATEDGENEDDDDIIVEPIDDDFEDLSEIDLEDIDLDNINFEEDLSFDETSEDDADDSWSDIEGEGEKGEAAQVDDNDDSDSAGQDDTDALYEELRKMKSSDMLQIEKDDPSAQEDKES